jgi:hypothetical protein
MRSGHLDGDHAAGVMADDACLRDIERIEEFQRTAAILRWWPARPPAPNRRSRRCPWAMALNRRPSSGSTWRYSSQLRGDWCRSSTAGAPASPHEA